MHCACACVLGVGFYGLPSLTVPKGSTVTYAVQYKGAYAGKSEGVLVLKNAKAAGDSFQYR